MEIICQDGVISVAVESVLLRSATLSKMHQGDPGGCVSLRFDSQTWIAWLTDNSSQMTTDTIELLVSVIEVRPLYARDFWMLAGASTCSLPWVCGNTLLLEANAKHHLIIFHCGNSTKSRITNKVEGHGCICLRTGFLAVSVGKCSVAIAMSERANLKDVCK
jgi:hypothetical protein